jgi:hypothetical protein
MKTNASPKPRVCSGSWPRKKSRNFVAGFFSSVSQDGWNRPGRSVNAFIMASKSAQFRRADAFPRDTLSIENGENSRLCIAYFDGSKRRFLRLLAILDQKYRHCAQPNRPCRGLHRTAFRLRCDDQAAYGRDQDDFKDE